MENPSPEPTTSEPPTPDPTKPWENFKILERTILVENSGEEFEFAIPTSMTELKVGAAIRRLRREADPTSVGPGEADGWDDMTQIHTRAMANFMVCLERTSAKWVYSADQNGKPVIDPNKWPAESVERILEINFAFGAAVQRFRSSRNLRT